MLWRIWIASLFGLAALVAAGPGLAIAGRCGRVHQRNGPSAFDAIP